MSQENKNIQPSSNSQTQQSSSPNKPPFWKFSFINALQRTIARFKTSVVNLETESPPSREKQSGFLQKLQQLWSGILGKIRLILPAKFSAKLSDTTLTGTIAGITIMVFLITSNFLNPNSSQVATLPPDTEIAPVVSTTNPEPIASEVSSQQEPVTLPSKEEIPPIIEQKAASVEITTSLNAQQQTITEELEVIPAKIEQKAASQEFTTSLSSEEDNVSDGKEKIPSLEVTSAQEELETIPTPTPLTPEETLLAAIQNQLAEITVISNDSNSEENTFSGIIESIQANFLESNITVIIENYWYTLSSKQQNELAAEIQQRSQDLDFTHLEITDLQGNLLARNPVIGTNMVIFKRRNDV